MWSPEAFRERLATARSESDIVIAINVDIRGFSRFSLRVESIEAAIFIRKFYDRLLSDYFEDPSFFKPTGDGMLLIFVVDEDSLQARSNELVEQSLRLLEEFPAMVADQPIINFPVPDAVGIGIARGAASRLVAGDEVLDYSGKVLNLASRLMDVARPSGLVLDSSFGFALLREELAAEFARDEIYVRSVAERRPIEIFFTSELTEIPAAARKPIDQIEWHTQTRDWTYEQIVEFDTSVFWMELERAVLDLDEILVTAVFPDVLEHGSASATVRSHVDVPYKTLKRAGVQSVALDMRKLAIRLERLGLAGSWDVALEIAYPLADG